MNSLQFAVDSFLLALRSEAKSPKTVLFYADSLGAFLRFLEQRGRALTVAEVQTSDCREFMADMLSRNLSPATVDDRRRALNRFFNWLVEEEDIEVSPMARVRPVRVPVQVIPSYSAEEIATLLNNCSGRSFEDARDKALILALYDTGLRLAEISGIQTGDIDWGGTRIKVMGKGSRERFVGMGSRLQRTLLRWLRVRGTQEGALWATRQGTPLTSESVRSVVKRRLKEAGIRGPRAVHRFRNTFAVSFLENGGHPDDLREILGHSTDQMVRRYTRYGAQDRAVRSHQNHSPADRLHA